ncbi:hypothetical protein [Massilia yuzhufengensis]|uniref:Uncharacterized protein n=1 Tax=Massilia yuzhufengensis TaxID=1164594 RepID=A0A1I1DP61_9BURK|nr:hypothetical protein [Massilia yuzhufengensis]SFB74343.1 hypothetical protein SAMN05216204_101210 [Massilia yuzhufengensis]
MPILKFPSFLAAAQERQTRIALAAPFLTVLFLSFWHWRIAENFSLRALASYLFLIGLFAGYGKIFLTLIRDRFTQVAGFPLQLLSGFFVFNTAFFILTLVSTLGMRVNLLIMALVCLAGLWVLRKRVIANPNVYDPIPALLAVVVSGIAATIWVTDSQAPTIAKNGVMIYQTWQDTFIHVREISEFAQARGVATIHDLRLAGVAAPIYHFASYVTAAAVTLVTPLSALEAYSGFQLPFGIFLTGLGAFSLISTLLGRWPAVVGVVAVVLLPDAYHQGFGNRYLSYSFLAQVNLGMLYGIACAAISWMFILEACRRQKYSFILVAYIFLTMSLFYKAHVFVANAFLIMIYPCIFFETIKLRLRVFLGILGIALFIAVIALSQSTGKVPLLTLDFSGIPKYSADLLDDFDQGGLKDFFTRIFLVERPSKPLQGLYAVTMILVSTFGFWLPALAAVLIGARKHLPLVVLIFPVIVLINYVVMATGLAYDTRGIGSPDEMMNRPLVWAYYVIAAWTGGTAYFLIFGDKLPATSTSKFSLGVAGVVALLAPLPFYERLQTFPAWKMGRYADFNATPECLVRAAEFIRDKSEVPEIIQDSANDPKFIFTALAERQSYVSAGPFGPKFAPVQDRATALVDFMELNNENDVLNFVSKRNISWFLLRPDNKVAWPSSVFTRVKFKCGGYKLFKFSHDHVELTEANRL